MTSSCSSSPSPTPSSSQPVTGNKVNCWYSFIVAALGILLYVNTLNADFAYDDSRAIKTNPDLRRHSPVSAIFRNDFWGTPLTHSGSHKSYRPLCVLSFRLNYHLHQLDPWGYHLVNVLLHGLVCGLFTHFSATLFNGSVRPTLVSGLLFAVHPIHTEAVAGLVGRADTGAALFFLLSLMAYVKFCKLRDTAGQHQQQSSMVNLYLYGSLVLAACSMFTKEHGITVLAVAAVYHVFLHCKLWPISRETLSSAFTEKRFSGLRLGVLHLSASAVALIALRLQLMGLKTPDFAPADNPASDAHSWSTRAMTFVYLPVFNFHLLLYPRWLSFDWSMEAIPLIRSPFDVRNIFSAIFYYGLFVLIRTIGRKAASHSKVLSLSSSNLSAIPSLIWSPSPPSLCLSCVCQSFKQPTNQPSMGSVGKQQQQHRQRQLHSLRLTNNNNNNGSTCTCTKHQAGQLWPGCTWSLGSSLYTFSSSSSCDTDETSSTSSQSTCSSVSRASHYSMFKTSSVERLGLATALLVLPFLPATNLFFYVGFVVAERILYIPSMGYCLFIAIGIEVLMERKTSKFITMIGISILLMSLAARTFVRNIDWQNEEKLYRAGIPINPPKAYGNLGNILSTTGKKVEAESAYRKALSFRPNMADVHYNLGILLQEESRLEEALVSYQNAIRFRPRLAMAHLNLGIVLGELDRKEEAADVFKHCAGLDGTGLKDPRTHESTRISALFNLGRLFADDARYQDAIGVYREAISRMPKHYQAHSLYNMMGEAYFKLGNFAEAQEWYIQALKVKPGHIPAHLTMAKLLFKMTRLQEAEQWFLKAKSIAPNDSSVYQHYGQFLCECERHEEAAEIYLKGVQVSPGDYEMVFNAANALRQAKRNMEAERFYKEAVILRPNQVMSHMNLGAMLHVNGKLLEAEVSYLQALKLRPEDIITQGNLAKLRHLLNQKRVLRH
ncbi:Protein O-mannosyl-transferase TMTC2 [Halotydeus destructor]|nr:Protein O-mannosyl-transferase TMTC2 [Halotydeus destructor]